MSAAGRGDGGVTRAGRLVEVGLLALVTVSPLVYVPELVNLYRLPKQTFLPLAASLLFWVVTLAVRRETGMAGLPLFWPVVANVLVTLLSLTQAVNLYQGLFASAHTIGPLGFFWLTAVFLTRRKAILRLFHWASLAAALVSVIGIAQVWGLAIPTLLVTDGGHGATFGNVNMAAQYLVLVLPMAYARLLLADRGPAQWWRALVAALPTLYLSYTGTRAAWAGLAIAVVLLVPLLVLTRAPLGVPWRAKAPALASVLGLVVAMNLLPSLVLRDFGASRYSPISRVATLAEAEEETGARFRVATTANTLVMFKDHPVLGVGKGNFQIVYPLYARAVFVDPVYGPRTRVPEAHNDYAQLLAETGILGFAAFAWLLVGLARRFLGGLASVGDEVGRVLTVASAFALTGLLGEALFDFPFTLPVSSGFLWIVAGILWRTTEVQQDKKPRQSKNQAQRGSSWTSPLAFGLLALGATATAAWGLHLLRAEYHFSRGFWAARSARLSEALSEVREAVRLNPYNDRYWFYLGVYHLRARNYQAVTFDSLRTLALNPHHIGSLTNLGAAYLAMGKLLTTGLHTQERGRLELARTRSRARRARLWFGALWFRALWDGEGDRAESTTTQCSRRSAQST